MNSTTNCISCNSGYFPKRNTSAPCYYNLPGWFLNSGYFDQCDYSCQTCNGSSNNCILCNSNYYKKYGDSYGYCYNSIPSGYFLDTSVYPNLITPCDFSCIECTLNSRKCISCKASYYKKANDSSDFCYTSISGFYLNSSYSPNLFSACDSSCKECSGNPLTCDLCNTNYYYKENEISKACYSSIKGYYLNSNLSPNKFSLCVSPCTTCSSLTVCLTCIDTYFIKDDEITGVCYSQKPFGYYLNASYNPSRYSKCDISCNDCDSLYTCFNCSIGYYKKVIIDIKNFF